MPRSAASRAQALTPPARAERSSSSKLHQLAAPVGAVETYKSECDTGDMLPAHELGRKRYRRYSSPEGSR